MNLKLGIQLAHRCQQNRCIGKCLRTFLMETRQSWERDTWETFWEQAFLYIEEKQEERSAPIREWNQKEKGEHYEREQASYEQGIRYGIGCVALGEPDYPEELTKLSAPPILLFYRGKYAISTLHSPIRITIVGTRHPSAYGKALTQELVRALTQVQIPVISGFAHGIDRVAHAACCQSGGRTVAVLAQGADRCYPGANRDLLEPILHSGGFVTTHPPGTEPRPRQFPARNRLLSALATAVVIPEAGIQSGSLITAGFAAEQNIPVFAAPGNIYSPLSTGTNQLIEEGALLYRNVTDFMGQLQHTLKEAFHPVQLERERFLTRKSTEKQFMPQLDDLERKILNELRAGTRTLADWLLEAGASQSEWTLRLTRLELRGLISLEGDRYSVTDSGLQQIGADSG